MKDIILEGSKQFPMIGVGSRSEDAVVVNEDEVAAVLAVIMCHVMVACN